MPYGDEKSYAFFKMKGSPMQRNFGTSPMKDREAAEAKEVMKKEVETYESMWKNSDTYRRLKEANAPVEVMKKAKDNWSSGEKKSLN